MLRKYWWPGNIRELENLIERLVAVSDKEWISEEDLPLEFHFAQLEPKNGKIENLFEDATNAFERNFILRALEKSDWNVTATAEYSILLSTLKTRWQARSSPDRCRIRLTQPGRCWAYAGEFTVRLTVSSPAHQRAGARFAAIDRRRHARNPSLDRARIDPPAQPQPSVQFLQQHNWRAGGPRRNTRCKLIFNGVSRSVTNSNLALPQQYRGLVVGPGCPRPSSPASRQRRCVLDEYIDGCAGHISCGRGGVDGAERLGARPRSREALICW